MGHGYNYSDSQLCGPPTTGYLLWLHRHTEYRGYNGLISNINVVFHTINRECDRSLGPWKIGTNCHDHGYNKRGLQNQKIMWPNWTMPIITRTNKRSIPQIWKPAIKKTPINNPSTRRLQTTTYPTDTNIRPNM